MIADLMGGQVTPSIVLRQGERTPCEWEVFSNIVKHYKLQKRINYTNDVDILLNVTVFFVPKRNEGFSNLSLSIFYRIRTKIYNRYLVL